MPSDLSHFDDLVNGQDRGADLVVKHPVTGDVLPDVVLIITGPDSDTARRARLQFQDELFAFKGRPPQTEVDRLDIECLARKVIGWRVKRDGKDVDYSFTAAVRMFTSFTFIREQAEAFAASRVPYFLKTPFVED